MIDIGAIINKSSEAMLTKRILLIEILFIMHAENNKYGDINCTVMFKTVDVSRHSCIDWRIDW